MEFFKYFSLRKAKENAFVADKRVIVSLLGEPDATDIDGNIEELKYIYCKKGAEENSLVINSKHGKFLFNNKGS